MDKGDFDVREVNAALGLLKLIREKEDPKGSYMRTRKTTFQMMVLKEVFRITQHPSTSTKMDLGLMIRLPFKAIQIWFQNERSKKENERKMRNRSGTKAENIDPTKLMKIIRKVTERSRGSPG